MYTILINNDKHLTTSVRETLLRHTTTDGIQFLLTPDNVDEELPENIEIETTYSAVMYYKGADNVAKSEILQTDIEPYKDRIRFVLPSGAAFFNNVGLLQIWLEITVDTVITTIDEETGEPTVEEYVKEYEVFPTAICIEEVPLSRRRHGADDNSIVITRGDSLEVDVLLTDNAGYPYQPVEGDTVYFRVKKSAYASDVLIEKTIDINTLVLNLVEADTNNLAFGEYKYEIEIVLANDIDHYTVIKNAPFIITEELH